MFAVTEMTTSTRHTSTLLASSVALVLAACGGSAPVGDGYPTGDKDPWTSAKKLKLTDNWEASTEGSVSFAKQERAKWYVLELPNPGKITARLSMDPLTTGADVGFEILDAGFNVNAGPLNDDDIGQDKKVREVAEARAGRTYFHVYTLGRGDNADFKLRVKVDPQEIAGTPPPPPPSDNADPRSTFPWTVPNLPALAAVPPKDDTPTGKHRASPPPDEDEKPAVVADPADGARVRAGILESSQTASGVRIVINKGSDAGIEEGWVGYVIDPDTKRSYSKGAFKIKKVKSDESEGVVGLTLDQVQRSKQVSLKPAE
jgi:hypothetical protein